MTQIIFIITIPVIKTEGNPKRNKNINFIFYAFFAAEL